MNTIKTLIVCSFLSTIVVAQNQTVIVSGQAIDSTGQVYANGTWQANFVPTQGIAGPFTLNGQPFTQAYSGQLDSSGNFTVTVADNTTVKPGGSQWSFVVCPDATFQCSTYTAVMAGVTANITPGLTSVMKPMTKAIKPTQINSAYQDNEMATAIDGNTYFNTTLFNQRIWFNGVWNATGGGAGGGIVSINGDNTAAQAFTGGTGITITNTGGGGHTITSTVTGGIASINTDTTSAQTLIGGTGITITNNGTGGHTINSSAVGGTVTAFSSGNLSPLFTTSVATSTTTPALSFTASNQPANTIFSNFSSSSAVPTFSTIAACGDSTHALSYVSGAGFGCQTLTGGAGGVTSVGLSAPNNTFTVTGSPVTTSGTLALGLQNQGTSMFWRGPTPGTLRTPFIQQTNNCYLTTTSGTTMTLTCALLNATTAGNTIVAFTAWQGDGASCVCSYTVVGSDTQGNTYSVARMGVGSNTNNPDGSLLYSPAIIGGADTVTLTYTGGTFPVQHMQVFVVEVAGVTATPFDSTTYHSAGTLNPTSAPYPFGSVTTTAANDIVLGFVSGRNVAGFTFTASTWPAPLIITQSIMATALVTNTAATAGTYTPTINYSNAGSFQTGAYDEEIALKAVANVGSSAPPIWAPIVATDLPLLPYIASINGDTTSAQTIVAGTGITVTDGGNGAHTIAATGGAGSTALSSITAATGNNLIANGVATQTWQWQPTTTLNGMVFQETNVSGTGTGALVSIQPKSPSLTALDITSSGGTSSYLHFGSATNSGGWLFTPTGGSTNISASAQFLNSAWIARNISASIFEQNNGGTPNLPGGFAFYGNTGLTTGNTFTPTLTASLNSSGNLLLTGLAGTGIRCLHTDASGNISAFPSDCESNPVANISGTYNATATDFQTCSLKYVSAGSVTVNLVINTSQPLNGQCMIFMNYGNGSITINRNGQNINGGTVAVTVPAAGGGSTVQPNSATVWSDGTNYFVTRGNTSIAFGNVTAGTSTVGLTVGNAGSLTTTGTGTIAATSIGTTGTAGSASVFGGLAQTNGLKHQRFAAPCTTTAAANGTCVATLTWTTAFPDNNYTPLCNTYGSTAFVQYLLTQLPASIQVAIMNVPGVSTAQSPNIYCMAMHD